MVDNNTGNNSQTGSNPGAQGPTYPDWREQRWEWRRKVREARRNRPFHGLFGGLVLILLGVLFLANQQNWVSGNAWWQWLLIGLGGISIISGLVQYHAPEYHHSRQHRFVWGAVLIALGAVFLMGFSHWWPAVLIGAGVAILLGGLW
jgi:cytochrome c biogenesis protein CcdA